MHSQCRFDAPHPPRGSPGWRQARMVEGGRHRPDKIASKLWKHTRVSEGSGGLHVTCIPDGVQQACLAHRAQSLLVIIRAARG